MKTESMEKSEIQISMLSDDMQMYNMTWHKNLSYCEAGGSWRCEQVGLGKDGDFHKWWLSFNNCKFTAESFGHGFVGWYKKGGLEYLYRFGFCVYIMKDLYLYKYFLFSDKHFILIS